MDKARDEVEGERRVWLLLVLLVLTIAAVLAPLLGGPSWLNQMCCWLAGVDFFCVVFEDDGDAPDA